MSKEKYIFIQNHEKEIRPLINDQESLQSVVNGSYVPAERVQSLLEQYETKVLLYERKDAPIDAGRLLFESAQPATFNVIDPLIELLERDEQCAGITLLADNVAGKKFLAENDPHFHVVPSSEHPVFADIPEGPYRAALVLDEGENAPSSVLLYGAKSVFGAEKLYYLSLGLFGRVAKNIFESSAAKQNEIDFVFSLDEFSKQMFCSVLGVPEEKVIITGTPLLEGLRVEESDVLRQQGRKALHIADEATTLLYAGFPSGDFQSAGGDPKLNSLTFEQTLAGVVAAATAEPTRKISLIVRTHPRARNVEPPLTPMQELPHNMNVVDGDGLTYEEAVYASDIICCNIYSTESLLARYRGREAAVFAFPGKGQLGEILRDNYSEKGEDIIRQSDRMNLIDSPQGISEMIRNYQPREALPFQTDSLERIKNILLSSPADSKPLV
mgnify:CR=1 FL=1